MRSKDTIEFLGLWEQLNNTNFKYLEFEGVKNQAGANAFTMSPKAIILIVIVVFTLDFVGVSNRFCSLFFKFSDIYNRSMGLE